MQYKFTFFCLLLGGTLGMLPAQRVRIADFTATPNPVCIGRQIDFQDRSTGFLQPSYFFYDFGDGSFNTGSPNFTHTYTAVGTYDVTYCVFEANSNDSACVTKQIRVAEGPCNRLDTLEGLVFYDVDQNGSFSGQDYAVSGKVITVAGRRAISGLDGRYKIPVPAGTFIAELTDPQPFQFSNPTTGRYTRTFLGSGVGISQTANFALSAPLATQDLRIKLGGWRMRAGRPSVLYVSYGNDGTGQMAGTVRVFLPTGVTYLSASQTATLDGLTRRVDVPFNSLQPGETRYLEILLRPDRLASVGQGLAFRALIDPVSTDLNPPNNADTFRTEIVGDAPPVRKVVSPGVGPEGYVKPGTELTYRIEFQNTWRDTVFRFQVSDTLDPRLNLLTFKMLGASHPYTYLIDEQRTITWEVRGLFPDSAISQTESRGYVQFAISPIEGVADGARIENEAVVLFTENEERTNQTLTTISSTTALDPAQARAGMRVYPNPATEMLYVEVAASLRQGWHFDLTDAAGRRVRQVGGNQPQTYRVELDGLAPGIYHYSLRLRDGNRVTGSVVIR